MCEFSRITPSAATSNWNASTQPGDFVPSKRRISQRSTSSRSNEGWLHRALSDPSLASKTQSANVSNFQLQMLSGDDQPNLSIRNTFSTGAHLSKVSYFTDMTTAPTELTSFKKGWRQTIEGGAFKNRNEREYLRHLDSITTWHLKRMTEKYLGLMGMGEIRLKEFYNILGELKINAKNVESVLNGFQQGLELQGLREAGYACLNYDGFVHALHCVEPRLSCNWKLFLNAASDPKSIWNRIEAEYGSSKSCQWDSQKVNQMYDVLRTTRSSPWVRRKVLQELPCLLFLASRSKLNVNGTVWTEAMVLRKFVNGLFAQLSSAPRLFVIRQTCLTIAEMSVISPKEFSPHIVNIMEGLRICMGSTADLLPQKSALFCAKTLIVTLPDMNSLLNSIIEGCEDQRSFIRSGCLELLADCCETPYAKTQSFESEFSKRVIDVLGRALVEKQSANASNKLVPTLARSYSDRIGTDEPRMVLTSAKSSGHMSSGHMSSGHMSSGHMLSSSGGTFYNTIEVSETLNVEPELELLETQKTLERIKISGPINPKKVEEIMERMSGGSKSSTGGMHLQATQHKSGSMSFGSSVIPNLKILPGNITRSGSLTRGRVSMGESKFVIKPSADYNDQQFAEGPGDNVHINSELDHLDFISPPTPSFGASGEHSGSEGKSENQRIDVDVTSMWQRPSRSAGKLGIPPYFPRGSLTQNRRNLEAPLSDIELDGSETLTQCTGRSSSSSSDVEGNSTIYHGGVPRTIKITRSMSQQYIRPPASIQIEPQKRLSARRHLVSASVGNLKPQAKIKKIDLSASKKRSPNRACSSKNYASSPIAKLQNLLKTVTKSEIKKVFDQMSTDGELHYRDFCLTAVEELKLGWDVDKCKQTFKALRKDKTFVVYEDFEHGLYHKQQGIEMFWLRLLRPSLVVEEKHVKDTSVITDPDESYELLQNKGEDWQRRILALRGLKLIVPKSNSKEFNAFIKKFKGPLRVQIKDRRSQVSTAACDVAAELVEENPELFYFHVPFLLEALYEIVAMKSIKVMCKKAQSCCLRIFNAVNDSEGRTIVLDSITKASLNPRETVREGAFEYLKIYVEKIESGVCPRSEDALDEIENLLQKGIADRFASARKNAFAALGVFINVDQVRSDRIIKGMSAAMKRRFAKEVGRPDLLPQRRQPRLTVKNRSKPARVSRTLSKNTAKKQVTQKTTTANRIYYK